MTIRLVIMGLLILGFGLGGWWYYNQLINPNLDQSNSLARDLTFSQAINIELIGAKLIRFSEDNYRLALDWPIVMLYFGADWCSPCFWELKNDIKPVFDDWPTESVIGLVIPWHDKQASDFSHRLSQELAITKPQTKIWMVNGQVAARADRPLSQSELNQLLSALADALNLAN